MNLFLVDIDGVLLPWDDLVFVDWDEDDGPRPHYNGGGFTDWRRINRRYFSLVSDEQLALITKLTKVHDVRWLTTWSLHGMHPIFEEVTGFGPLIPWPLDNWDTHSWWKASVVQTSLETGAFDEYERVVWVDDDHKGTDTSRLAEAFDERRIDLVRVAPFPVWSREEIELWMP